MSGKRRADADRNAAAVVAAAIGLMGRGGDLTMAEVAAAAGTTRQTVYAHFPGRAALLTAVTARLTELAAQALSDVEPRRGPAGTALERWLDAAWSLLERYPVYLHPALVDSGTDPERHAPILGDLEVILRRARREGVLVPGLGLHWAMVSVIALGHAAAAEVAAGRMRAGAAGTAYRRAVLRLCLDVGAPS